MKLPSHVGLGAIDVETTPAGAVLVSVPQLPGLGYGSTAPIVAICAVCRRPQRPTVNPALTALYQRVATGQPTLYGSLTTCGACARAEE